eukprot:13654403-Alexandrium_andersonii.AAC.1
MSTRIPQPRPRALGPRTVGPARGLSLTTLGASRLGVPAAGSCGAIRGLPGCSGHGCWSDVGAFE